MKFVVVEELQKEPVRKTYRFRPELVARIQDALSELAAKGVQGISEQKLVESILEQVLSDPEFTLRIKK